MEDDTLGEDLRQAVGKLARAARAADTMPPGEATVLGYLDRDGASTTAELAHRRGVSHQSAARSVKELTAAGLVRAAPHPGDGRKLLLSLTDAGRARLRLERAGRAGWLDGALREALGAEERERLRACLPLLDRLTAHLGAHRR